MGRADTRSGRLSRLLRPTLLRKELPRSTGPAHARARVLHLVITSRLASSEPGPLASAPRADA